MKFLKKLDILFIPILSFFIYLTLAFNTVISYDSSFSVFISKLPLIELIKITATDVHPPLYYIIMKFFIILFTDNIYMLQILSIIPLIILSVFGAKKIKSLYSIKEAIYFQLLLLCTPFIISHSINIRMYSWAILFVTLSCINAVSIIEGNIKDFKYLTIYSLLASYTHTYALFFIAFLYLNIIIYFFISNKPKKELFISSAICLLLYSPWIFVLLNQVETVSSGFWISYSAINNYLNLFIFSSIFIGVIGFIINKFVSFDKNTYYFTVLPFIETVLFVLIYSKFIEPVFLTRYVTLGLGMVIVYLAVFASNIKHKSLIKVFYILLIVSFIAGYVNVFKIQYNQSNKQKNDYLVSLLDPNTVIISDIMHYTTKYSPLRYYGDYKTQYWLQNNSISTADNIGGLVRSTGTVEKLDLNNNNYLIIHDDNYLKIIDDKGYKYELLNSFDDFKVYLIKIIVYIIF